MSRGKSRRSSSTSSSVQRSGELTGLAAIIADLIEANLKSHPRRASLLRGKTRTVEIVATDLDASVSLELGGGTVTIAPEPPGTPSMTIRADSATLIELPKAKLLMGLPSLGDPIGRSITKKLLKGDFKVRGMYRVGLLSKVQRLLSVA